MPLFLRSVRHRTVDAGSGSPSGIPGGRTVATTHGTCRSALTKNLCRPRQHDHRPQQRLPRPSRHNQEVRIMDDAGLVDGLREDRLDRLREAAQPVGADEEHVLDAAVAQLGQYARPEAGALALLDPEAEAVAFALERDPDRDVDGLLADDL